MKAITVRNLPPEVARAVQRRAREKGLSLNKAIIALLEEGMGTRQGLKKEVVHHDLEHLAGTWSATEAAEFDAALHEQRHVDEELWE